MGDGTHAVVAPARGCAIFCATMSAIRSGMAHMPLPICALPANPAPSPVSTLWSSYARIHGCDFMTALRHIGPASMEVWISSPVRSRNPVLMKTTRSEAALMAAFRLTVVRRSSSMMPTLRVACGNPSTSSTRPNSSAVKATSSGPCILGFTM
ncbi:Uncharacterised protein [Mycobacteroides abscessus subsp. abscessus]|nr:Uncharacterised protein [Mycobacteroides abscessus subsp. abscessus]